MSLTLGNILYAFGYLEVDIDESAFRDHDTKAFIVAMKEQGVESVQGITQWGEIPVEPISKEAFIREYNYQLYCEKVNARAEAMKLALHTADWGYLATEFPELDNKAFKINKTITADQICLDNDGFYPFFKDWDEGFKGLRDDDLIVFFAPPKCFSKDTKVRMSDGSIKNVQDIVVGDKVMGRDSTPRNVVKLYSGKDRLYKIHQSRSNSYITNSRHDLILMKKFDNNRKPLGQQERLEEIRIAAEELFKKQQSVTQFRDYYGIKVGIEYSEASLPIDPYLFGLWLGDGRSEAMKITCHEDDFDEAYRDYLISKSLDFKVYKYKKQAPHILDVTIYNQNLGSCVKNKHIPISYLRSSSDQRLQLLAGIIDTDGHYRDGRFEVVTKSKTLRDDYIELSNTLGFFTRTSTKVVKGRQYYRVMLSGDISKIPTKLNRKKAVDSISRKSTISITEAGYGDFYGFECDGDHLFLLEDGTLVSNCGKTTITAYLAYEAIKSGIPVGFYPTELTQSVTLKYILGFEYGLRGNESLLFFDGYTDSNGYKVPGHREELKASIDKYSHLLYFPPTNIFNFNDYIALYESPAKFIFHDNFIYSLAQLGLDESASSASQFCRKLSTIQHKYRKATFLVTQEAMREATPKELEKDPNTLEYGKGYTSLTRSLLQDSSLAIHVRKRLGTQIIDLLVKNDRFRGSADINTQVYCEVTNRGKIRVTKIKDSIEASLERAERKLFESMQNLGGNNNE